MIQSPWYDDTWEFDGSQGLQVPVAVPPAGKFGRDLVFWPAVASVVCVGGATGMAPAIFTPTTTVGAAEQVSVSIPTNPSLSGSLLAAQGVTLDPTSINGFGAVSNAVVATLY